MTAAATTTMAAPITISAHVPLKFRHEQKHQLSLQEGLVLSARLKRLFALDPHAGNDGSYSVHSLYFDTPYDRALREKIDGVDRREKFRLRYYGTDASFVRLEKKMKRGGLCAKRSTRLSEAMLQELLKGNPACLRESDDPLLLELYSKLQGELLRPVCVVSYEREACLYPYGNVRITLDRKIQTVAVRHFLHPSPPSLSVLADICVLEVKYDAYLPTIVSMAVQVPGRQAMACSKYALCRRFD